MSPTYPDDCVQTLTSAWWIEDKADSIVRGRLLWTCVGADPSNWKTEPYVLSPEALVVVDEWLSWLMTGLLPDVAGLAFARANLPNL